MATTPTTTIVNRHGYSCGRCGEWFFTADRLPATDCPICEGRLACRGVVKPDRRVTFDVELSACDDRCTGAKGVKCDCQCGGRNHGSHRTVTVTVTAGIARVDLDHPGRLEVLRSKRLPLIAEAETLAAGIVARLEVDYRDVLADYRAGRWLPSGDFQRVRRWQDYRAGIRHANALKTPEGRLKALRRIQAEVAS